MAMTAGVAGQSGTMADEIYDALIADIPSGGATQDDIIRWLVAAIADGVVTHIAASADVTITTSNAGIQRYRRIAAGPQISTEAPASNQVLSSSIS